VSCYVLSGFNFAQQVVSVTADAFSSDFNSLDHTLRVDQEGSTISQALTFAHYTEVVGDGAGLVANHVVLNLADGFRRVVPSLVSEVSVGRHGKYFNAQLLQLFVFVGNVAQFGRANEGEVGRVEEEYGPLAFYVLFGDFYELTCFVRSCFERLDFGIDDTHVCFLLGSIEWIT